MCFILGGLNVKFPKGTRGKVGKRILSSIDKGYTTRQLADIYGTSTANIRAIKRYYKNKVKK